MALKDDFVSPSTLFLTGAPESHRLDWTGPHLLVSFDIAFKRFLNIDHDDSHIPDPSPVSSYLTSKWRQINVEPQLARYRDEPLNPNPSATQFLQPQDPDIDRDEFLDHSLAILERLDAVHIASQLPLEDTTFISAASFADTTSLTDFSTSFAPSTSSSAPPATTAVQNAKQAVTNDRASTVRSTTPVTDLNRLSNAAHITAIHPQTQTVNLCVALIARSPPRIVRTRRGTEMAIYELLVGDETRAGFSISCWLTPATESPPAAHPGKRMRLNEASTNLDSEDDALRALLSELRAGDVLLLCNVALTAFRGCVYGQTLSRRVARNQTSFAVLDTRGREGVVHATTLESLPAGAVSKGKVARVRAWADAFVGNDHIRRDPEGDEKTECLPPDETQLG